VVLHPNPAARCPMAAMAEADEVLRMKEEHPDAAVVSYVNTTADVKAVSDVCCTSANAVKVVRSLPNEEVIFVPDENLAKYVQRHVKDKRVIPWPGYCNVHTFITADKVMRMKERYPGARFIAHPECLPEVIDLAEHVASTEGMITFARSGGDEFILGTEKEMAYRLSRILPDKRFYTLENAVCGAMKKISFEDVVMALRNMQHEVVLSDEVLKRAYVPLRRMMEVGR